MKERQHVLSELKLGNGHSLFSFCFAQIKNMRGLILLLLVLLLLLPLSSSAWIQAIDARSDESYKPAKGGGKDTVKGVGKLLRCTSSVSPVGDIACLEKCPRGTTQIGNAGDACTFEISADKTGDSK